MSTIEERAKYRYMPLNEDFKISTTRNQFAEDLANAFIQGAIEQQNLDIKNACDALYCLMSDLGFDQLDVDKAKEYIRKTME